MKKLFGGICLFILLAFLIPSAPVHAAEKTIAKGVSIGNIDVSGMTVEQATATIDDYFDNILESEISLLAKKIRSSLLQEMSLEYLGTTEMLWKRRMRSDTKEM